MPVQTKPEDKPAAVRFHIDRRDNGFEVTCALLPSSNNLPYRLQGGAPLFNDRDAFKARVVQVGLSPAVAEEQDRSFNATARQLRELGFSVEVDENAA